MMPATLAIDEHTPADPLEYMRHGWRKGYGAGTCGAMMRKCTMNSDRICRYFREAPLLAAAAER